MSLPILTPMFELPVIGAPPAERCDAVRNRARIVAAALELFGERPVQEVSVDQIAAAAGVGKGTVFRRFGDRAGLLRAVLNDHEALFQDAFIRGPAPLGPGAPARERILAFGPAMLDHVVAHGDLLRAADARGRLNHSVYAAYRTHLMLLVGEADPALDADYMADVLLAPLSADLALFQIEQRGMPVERVAAGWRELAGRLIA